MDDLSAQEMTYDSGILNDIRMQQQSLLQSLAQFQLDFQEEIVRFENILTGKEYDDSTSKYVKRYEPLINDKGVSHIMKKMRVWMSKIIAQSDFSEHTINAWCRLYSREIVSDVYNYGDDWELTPDHYDSLVDDCVFTLHSMLLMAKDGGLREVIGKVTKVIETAVKSVPEIKNKNRL